MKKRVAAIMFAVFLMITFYTIAEANYRTTKQAIQASIDRNEDLKSAAIKINSISSQITKARVTNQIMASGDEDEFKELSALYVEFAELLNAYIQKNNELALEMTTLIIDIDYLQQQIIYWEEREKLLILNVEEAEKNYKIGKINQKMLKAEETALKDAKAAKEELEIKLKKNHNRFRELTGEDVYLKFDYAGAYLIMDMEQTKGFYSLAIQYFTPALFSDREETYTTVNLPDIQPAMEMAETNFNALSDAVIALAEADQAIVIVENDIKTANAVPKNLENAQLAFEEAKMAALDLKAAYAKSLLVLDMYAQGQMSKASGKKDYSFFNSLDTDFKVLNDAKLKYNWALGAAGQFSVFAEPNKKDEISFKINTLPDLEQEVFYYVMKYNGSAVTKVNPIWSTGTLIKPAVYNGTESFTIEFLDKNQVPVAAYYLDGLSSIGEFYKEVMVPVDLENEEEVPEELIEELPKEPGGNGEEGSEVPNERGGG